MQSNPFVDSFPRGSTISPYAPPSNKIHILKRTTKNSQKLVLLPDDDQPAFTDPAPTLGDLPLPIPDTIAEQSVKSNRGDLPRVTSYCCAETLNLESIAVYLKDSHGVNAIGYDECLLATYEISTKYGILGLEAKLSKMTVFVATFSLFPRTPAQVDSQAPTSQIESRNSQVFLQDKFLPDELFDSLSFPLWMLRSEIFFFDYGVIVFWNFSKEEEEKYLPIISSCGQTISDFAEMEVDELNFQYDLLGPKPRIFNDVITLKSSNPLIRLSISHALAQSVKLSLFENVIESTIKDCIYLPQQMATRGKISLDRTGVLKIVGELFDLRMNVNLVSNVMDTPELFGSEPELKGLYQAIRGISTHFPYMTGYFEISQRATLLNKRLEVVSDLLRMLSDHQDFGEKTYITYIVVILIAGCVVVAILEVWVKILRLRRLDS